MTENEAIRILDTEKQCLDKSTKGLCKINCGDCKANIPIVYQEKAYELAIFALKEIQQYRKIGTVEECREMASIISKVERNELAKIIDEWLLYKKIGTVEECREAVEKQKPKKSNCTGMDEQDCYICPNCGADIGDIDGYFLRDNYCRECGQAIQWDENLEEMENE